METEPTDLGGVGGRWPSLPVVHDPESARDERHRPH